MRIGEPPMLEKWWKVSSFKNGEFFNLCESLYKFIVLVPSREVTWPFPRWYWKMRWIMFLFHRCQNTKDVWHLSMMKHPPGLQQHRRVVARRPANASPDTRIQVLRWWFDKFLRSPVWGNGRVYPIIYKVFSNKSQVVIAGVLNHQQYRSRC